MRILYIREGDVKKRMNCSLMFNHFAVILPCCIVGACPRGIDRLGRPSWLLCNDHVLRINREIFDSEVIVRCELDCSKVWEQLKCSNWRNRELKHRTFLMLRTSECRLKLNTRVTPNEIFGHCLQKKCALNLQYACCI